MTGVSCAGCTSAAKGVAEAPVAGNASAGCTSIGLANAPFALGGCCATKRSQKVQGGSVNDPMTF